MKKSERNDLIYVISKEDIQYEARICIGRELTEDEMILFGKRLEYGIGENMLFIYPAIFEEIKKQI
ncbi:MAG: hypothetical protein LBK94_11605 [Prevotellaceae bacterium]|jgi:hypothetical protein|nr:hypothetical protein [Prevotellaceae bacterium]